MDGKWDEIGREGLSLGGFLPSSVSLSDGLFPDESEWLVDETCSGHRLL